MTQGLPPLNIVAAPPQYGPDNDHPEDGGISIRISRPTAPPSFGVVTSGAGTIVTPIMLQGSPAISFDHFLSYEYAQSWLTPSDAWQFTFSVDELSIDQRQALLPGALVEMAIDDRTQQTGYIDRVCVRASRGSGGIVTVYGRDWMAPSIDAQVDPKTRLLPSMSFLQFLTAIFAQFNLLVIAEDPAANLNIITGQTRGTKTSKKGKPLKSYILHAEKPYPNEGAYAFASRIAQRIGAQGAGSPGGLWIRAGADYGTLVVAKPNFDQDPLYSLHQKTGPLSQFNNILESDSEVSREEQFSVLFASGFGGGGDLPKSSLRCAVFNPCVEIPLAQRTMLLAAYPGINVIQDPRLEAIAQDDLVAASSFPLVDPNARPAYVYDPEAKTLDQLQAFAIRELSLRLRKSLSYKAVIEGHRIGGVPVAVDSIVDVDDDISDVHRPMWIMSRRFSKVLGGGTTTHLECIRPNSLVL